MLAALLTMIAVAGTAAAGPFEDNTAAYNEGNYATAYRLLRPLADQGNASAQARIGQMYREGSGVPRDYAEALKWFRKAADQGFAPTRRTPSGGCTATERACRLTTPKQ